MHNQLTPGLDVDANPLFRCVSSCQMPEVSPFARPTLGVALRTTLSPTYHIPGSLPLWMGTSLLCMHASPTSGSTHNAPGSMHPCSRSRSHGVTVEWLEDDCARISCTLPAFATDPLNGRTTWFNNAVAYFFGYSNELNDSRKTVTFGNGDAMPDESMQTLKEVGRSTRLHVSATVPDTYMFCHPDSCLACPKFQSIGNTESAALNQNLAECKFYVSKNFLLATV